MLGIEMATDFPSTFEEESHHSKGLLTVSPNVPKVITNRPTSYKKYVVYTLVL